MRAVWRAGVMWLGTAVAKTRAMTVIWATAVNKQVVVVVGHGSELVDKAAEAGMEEREG